MTSFLNRQPAMLLAAVSLLIGLVWYGLGLPKTMPRSPLGADGKLPCVSYAPFRGNQSPLDPNFVVPPEQIDADLERLSAVTSCVRTYAVEKGIDRVPEFARKHGLQVLQGIWIGRDPVRNQQEIETAVALVREYHDVIRGLVVGNEVLLRGELRASDLRDLIQDVKRQVDVPVTYADVWEFWLRNRDLVPAVDFVTIHILPYWEDFPVAAEQAAGHVTDIYRQVATAFAGKEIMIGEVGWPSEGRMREGALPSLSNQARVLHEVIAAARRSNWPINVIEAFDQPWKRQLEGTVGGHWGLLDSDTRKPKFEWGRPVRDHPLWIHQGALGVLFAFVIFAAAYLSARSTGENAPEDIPWLPIAGIGLSSGLFLGWALVQAPLESFTLTDWARSILLICIAFLVPPICAAAVARNCPMAGFATVLDPLFWRAAKPLERFLAGVLTISVIVGIALALGLVFDPRYRDFHFAPLTGPAAALMIASETCPAGLKRRGVAEWIAGAVLAASAIYISLNETPLNWQAQWFAALLLMLAASCWRLRPAQN
ncbi:MAG TPA: glycosyl hydrolase family 17 protein [Xanthobacteraceae bacterium]|nr:glycosyl hydrolase family 17 protein [Xanthobacteraceae bacterium]